MSVSISPEYALLLEASSPAAAPRAEAPDWDRAGWDRALDVADWHRLSPMLFRHLAPHKAAPAEVLGALEGAYLGNAARNMLVAASLERVLEALAAAGVPAMPLKGAALLRTVYRDPAVRELLDLDVLVPAAELGAANAALAAIGYRPEGAGAHHHAPALANDQGVTAVELHHHVATAEERGSFDFDIAGVWERARGPRAGLARLPSVEDLLIHVCFHFTRNRLGGSYRRGGTGGALAQIADVAWLLPREHVDWPALVEIVRGHRLGARVFLALFAASELGMPVPDQPLAALRPARFDPRIGRRLVALRVLRSDRHLPVRRLRWIVAPGREALKDGWEARDGDRLSLAAAYVRRARTKAPLVGTALRRPWAVVQDYRLNDQVRGLERGAR